MNESIVRKERVIQKITALKDEKLLSQIELLLNNTSDDMAFIQKYVKPIRQKTDIATLIKEKNYQGVNQQQLQLVVQTIDIPQSTDELLKML